MTLPDFLRDILIVIVLYKKKPWESVAFNSMQAIFRDNQFASIFIYDNSPEPCKSTDDHIIYQHDPHNHGVSRAYNEGFKVAERNNKRWMLLADQDTEFNIEVFEAFNKAVFHYPDIKLFTPILKEKKRIVSPYQLAFGKGIRIKKAVAGIYSLAQLQMINSGMLISLDAFKLAGGFDERFPLDLSDVVFVERFQGYYSHFVVINAECCHSLSANENSKRLNDDFERFVVFNHALRLYKKISRNFILLPFAILPRSFVLTMRYRNLNFIRLGLRTVISKA